MTLSRVPSQRGLTLEGFLQVHFADGSFVTYRTKLGGGGNREKNVLDRCFKHSGRVVFPADSMAGRSAGPPPQPSLSVSL